MSYLALYRQWRPQIMGEIVGQDHITRTLRNAVTAGKVSHAYLFCGPRGTGKTSAAKVLARAINCPEQKEGEPCNECRNCRDILDGSTMDVFEIDAASNRGIDEIRELKENSKFFPSRSSKRVYIVDEVHMLTNEAFNALLKTLEEPPGHVVFVLATTEPHKVPPTILSRCQRFDFRPIPGELIARHLAEVAAKGGYAAEPGAVRAITSAAAGSLRDALSVLDQALLLNSGGAVTADMVHGILGTVREEALQGLATALAEKKPAAALALVEQIAAGGHDLHLLVGGLTEYLRRLLLAMLTPGEAGLADNFGPAGENPPTFFTRDALVRVIDLLVEAEQVMRRSAHPRVVLEVALVRAVSDDGTPTRAELLTRIENLERALENRCDGSGNRHTSREAGAAAAKTRCAPSDEPLCRPAAGPPADTDAAEKTAPPAEREETGLVQTGLSRKAAAASDNEAAGAKQPERPAATEPSPKPTPDGLRLGAVKKTGAAVEKKPVRGNGPARYGIEQIRKWWPDMMNELKRVNPAIYTYLALVWPAEVKDYCLVLGVPRGDIFSMQMAEDQANRELLVKTLHSFTREDWSVRCNYYDAPPPGWDRSRALLEPEEAISLFRGEEIPPPGEMDKS